MPYCQNCGYEYEKGIQICPDCNNPLSEAEPIVCFNCEDILIDKTIFCPHCGYIQSEFLSDDEDIMCDIHNDTEATGCCVICGKAVCSDCAVEHSGRLFCNQDEHIKISENWAVVFTTNLEYEAEMVKANLEGAGIPCLVFSQRDHAYGVTIGNMAVVNVMVQKENLQEATEYLKNIDLFGENPEDEEED